MKKFRVSKVLHIPTLIAGLIITALVGGVMWKSLADGYEHDARIQADSKLTRLNQIMTLCTNATESMAVVVHTNGGEVRDFNRLAKSVYNSSEPITSVQLAPDGQVTYVYPLQGNEKGMINLFTDPDRRAEAIRARDTGELICAGPFELKQGGLGMAIRQPVYLGKKGDVSGFWGFSIVIVDVPKIVKESGFESLASLGYRCRLTAMVDGKEVSVSGTAPTEEAIRVSRVIYGKTWKIYFQPAIWSQDRLLLLFLVGGMVMLSFMVSLLRCRNHQLSASSVTDALTGLLNRRGFEDAVEQAIGSRSVRGGILVAMDINSFKTFNDLYGHSSGDALLRSFATELRDLVGSAGEVGRNGGDEFQIFLHSTAGEWIERLTQFCSRTHTYSYDRASYSYNISAGCSLYPAHDEDYTGLYRKADTALYHAKTSRAADGRFWVYSPQMNGEPREQFGFNFKDLSSGSPCSILIYKADESGQILYANKACVRLCGCQSLAEFMSFCGGSFKSLVDARDLQWAQETIRAQQARPDNRWHTDYLSFRIRTRDGHSVRTLDIGRKYHHEYYGDLYYVLLDEVGIEKRFARREDEDKQS